MPEMSDTDSQCGYRPTFELLLSSMPEMSGSHGDQWRYNRAANRLGAWPEFSIGTWGIESRRARKARADRGGTAMDVTRGVAALFAFAIGGCVGSFINV